MEIKDKHLTIPGALEWDSGSVERFTIAKLRYAGGSEHDVRYVSELDYDAALAREAALREDIAGALGRNDSSCEDVRTLNLIINSTANQRDALQQRLTVAEQREDELRRVLAGMLFAFDDGVGRGWSAPLLDYARRFTPAVEFELSINQLAALKPAEEVESPGARPVGCCCPPKGHTGIWAAAMCPVHFGLKRPGVKPAEECPHNYSNPTGCPVCQGVKP